MLNKFRVCMIDNLHSFFKFWSVRIDLISAALSTWAITHPDSIASGLNFLPPEVKAMIPPDWLPHISLALLVLSLLARSIKQPNLKVKDEPISNDQDQSHN